MSFAFPIALLLLLPLAGLVLMVGSMRGPQAIRLPGKWQDVVASGLRAYVARRSNLDRAGLPVLCFAGGALVIFALARPGLDAKNTEAYANLAGRVIVMDVGADLSRHRGFMDALHRADPNVATAVIASSGDAYRIVPFTTDKSQIDRYVRVLNAGMMPRPGQSPHIALAQAERALDNAGYLVRQIVVLSERAAPAQDVQIPPGQSQRVMVPLADPAGWRDWASLQDAAIVEDDAVARLTARLKQEAMATARSELPSARTEFTTLLIGLAGLLWLLLFRRRGT